MKKILISVILTTQFLFGQEILLDLQKDCILRSEEISSMFQDTLIQIMFKASGNAEHNRYYESQFNYNGYNEIELCSMDGWDIHFRPNHRFIYARLAYFNRKTKLPNFCAVDSFIIDYKSSLTFMVDTVPLNAEECPNVYFIDSIVTKHQVEYPITIYLKGEEQAIISETESKIFPPKAIDPKRIEYLVKELQKIHEEFNNIGLKL